jgi:hypothetical protein
MLETSLSDLVSQGNPGIRITLGFPTNGSSADGQDRPFTTRPDVDGR